MEPYATTLFDNAQHNLSLIATWSGTLAYSFQIYFDFSGYSDMAIGLAYIFGIRLPLNFDSPYKAINIVDFWRRWHMTLSRFLRDYLYVPLGGNRHGPWHRYRNLFLVMLLGGLWHGAGWNFVFWGGLHGLYLSINHAWRRLRQSVFGHDLASTSLLGRTLSRLLTFLGVVIAWVFFRAENWNDSQAILKGMAGLNGISRIDGYLDPSMTIIVWLAFLCIFVWFAPNTQQLLDIKDPAVHPPGSKPESKKSMDTKPQDFKTNRIMQAFKWGDIFSHHPVGRSILVWLGIVTLLVVAVRGTDEAPFIYMFF